MTQRGRPPHASAQPLLAAAIAVLLATAGVVVVDRQPSASSGPATVLADPLPRATQPSGTPPPGTPPSGTTGAATTPATAAPAPTPSPAGPPTPPATQQTPAPTPAASSADPPAPPAPAAPTPSPLPDLPTDQPADPTGAPATPADERRVVQTDLAPFATVGGFDVHHPAMFVERIGLHQSNHEGARDLTLYDTAAAPVVLESRGRLSGPQSAADVVVDPTTPIIAPVSGVVARAGSYTLYCDFTDEFAVIVPDGQPSWEVKLLHLVGLQVSSGQRVEAGVTVLAQGARTLPFQSQVDEHTAEPSWPHTHLEVVDTAIPNQPNAGSGSEDCR